MSKDNLTAEVDKFDRPVVPPDGAPTQLNPGKTDAPVAETIVRTTLTYGLAIVEAGIAR